MKHYIGLDVSMKETSICVLNESGLIVSESTVPTEPHEIFHYLQSLNKHIGLIGLESGCLSHWLTDELLKKGLPVKCIDARHCAAFLSMRINKTDRNDARGIADVMRCGIYREVQVKSKDLREISSLLSSRRTLVEQRTQLIMTIRGLLKPFGIRLGSIPKTKSGLLKTLASLSIYNLQSSVEFAVIQLLNTATMIANAVEEFDRKIKLIVKQEPKAQLLMSIPGVGPVTALRFLVEIGDPKRFKKSRSVGAYIGLTPRQYASGETQRQGRISKCGSRDLRSLLVEAAIVLMTRTKSWSKLKSWGVRLMAKKGLKKAATAVARKLAVVMHQMILQNEPFRFGEEKKELKAA